MTENDRTPGRGRRRSGLLEFVTGRTGDPAPSARRPSSESRLEREGRAGRAGRAPSGRQAWRDPAEGPGRAPGPIVVADEQFADHDPLVDPVYDADDRNWVRYRPAWGGVLRLLLFGFVVVAALLWLRNAIYAWVDAQVDPAGPQGAPVEFTVVPGSSVNDIAGDLNAAGVISNSTVFRFWLRCDGELTITGFLGCDSVTSVEAGDYLLNENMGFEAVLEALSEGPEFSQPAVFERITIPEGLRWTEMADLLVDRNPAFVRSELESAFASLVDEADYLPPDAEFRTLEGLLFPATYEITPSGLADEQAFLRRLSDEFDRRFSRLLAELDLPPGQQLPPELAELGLRPYDVVVAASLIEEEAVVPEDRPKIARVIYNRLNNDEPLYIDASVCYGADKSCLDLTRADLERETPWNTRLVRGLPPTPISAPGEASMRAALQPADGDWVYYVRTDEGGVAGAHHFSVTLEEHNSFVPLCRDLGYCR